MTEAVATHRSLGSFCSGHGVKFAKYEANGLQPGHGVLLCLSSDGQTPTAVISPNTYLLVRVCTPFLARDGIFS